MRIRSRRAEVSFPNTTRLERKIGMIRFWQGLYSGLSELKFWLKFWLKLEEAGGDPLMSIEPRAGGGITRVKNKTLPPFDLS